MNIDKEVLKHIQSHLSMLHKGMVPEKINIFKDIVYLFKILLHLNVQSVKEIEKDVFEIKVQDSESLFLKREGSVNIYNEIYNLSYYFVKPVQTSSVVYK